MSGKALRDRNMLPLPVSGKKNENSNKGSFMNAFTDVANENLEMAQSKHHSPLGSIPLNNGDAGNNGIETTIVEVEYIESENLTDLLSVETSLNTLLARLDSKDWVLLCEALNNVRQISIYHKEKLFGMLGNVIIMIVKSLKNPRSAVCKTAIMTTADIFKVYGDETIDSIDPLLVQLLLKSSQDKRFVCEAAERALIAMTTYISPSMLLPKLQPYLKHKNPRIRAKASMCFCRSVPCLGPEGIKTYGIDKLVLIAATQLSDQLPESREAARILALELQKVYENFEEPPVEETVESVTSGSWEEFCQSKLSPLSAQAIIRVTSIVKEGVVVGS